MPAINTHNRLLADCVNEDRFNRESGDINILVSEITFEILKGSPGLVAGVANGETDKAALETEIIKVIDRRKYHFGLFRDEIIKKVFDFMFGYGELQKYIEDEDVTDIDGTKYNEFAVKKNGIRERIPVNFGSEKMFDAYCKLVAVRNRGILNENDSHCRVTDEKYRLRINVSVKPRNISGPAISIRKHRKASYTLDDLVRMNVLGEDMASLAKKLAVADATVLFCGKGAAGKTTLMRAFVNALPKMERVLIAESDAEIYPDKPYCIEQRIKKPNEGGRPVTLKELVRDGLTMSLDTYCVGEIVGDEAWEFIKAAFSGHRGIATMHSESAEDAFARLLTLSKGAGAGESEKTIKEMMARSIDAIFYIESFKVADVLEVLGYESHTDKFLYNRLFKLDVKGRDENGFLLGEFKKCGEPGERLLRKKASYM